MKMILLAALAVPAIGPAAPTDPARAERLQAIAKERAEQDQRYASDPCLRRRGNAWQQLRWRDCLKFGPRQRMQGVWYDGFEESGFVPNVRTVSLIRDLIKDANPEFDIYLDIDRVAAFRLIKMPQFHICTRAVAIEFIGRRSVEAGAYYTGDSNYVIVVDRVIRGRFFGNVQSNRPGGRDRKCGS